jgi:outer membrane protein assembly factor BamB
VLVGTGDGFVYSLDATNGSVLWKSKTEGVVDTAPAAGDGKVFAVGENTSSGRARLYAFDAATGRTTWSYSPGRFGVLASSPSVIPGTVFEAFGDRSVVALDTANGMVRWKQQVRGDFAGTSAPAFAGGSLFVIDREGGLYRLDARTGKRRWDYQFSAFSAGSAPLVVGANVFQGLDDGTIAAVSAATGRLRWQTKPGRGPIGPLTPAGELLLAPAQGPTGGVLAFQNDPAGALLNVPSPSTLRPGIALRNFGAALALMLLGILAFFRLLLSRRPRADEGQGDPTWAEDEGTHPLVPEGDA